MFRMNVIGEFVRLTDSIANNLKEELSRVEEKGVEAHIEEVFMDKFDRSPLCECFWSSGYNVPEPHEGLGFNGEIEFDDGIYLHHFALTNNGIVVAVCDSEDEGEFYYRIEGE